MEPTIFDPEAKAELADAMEYYELQRPGLGRDFRDEVEPYKHTEQRRQAVRRTELGISPNSKQRLLFPFEIFYSVLPEVIWAAVAHSKRRPDYWTGRRPE